MKRKEGSCRHLETRHPQLNFNFCSSAFLLSKPFHLPPFSSFDKLAFDTPTSILSPRQTKPTTPNEPTTKNTRTHADTHHVQRNDMEVPRVPLHPPRLVDDVRPRPLRLPKLLPRPRVVRRDQGARRVPQRAVPLRLCPSCSCSCCRYCCRYYYAY